MKHFSHFILMFAALSLLPIGVQAVPMQKSESTVSSGTLKLSTNNIDKVIGAMTLEEKVSLLIGYISGNNYFGLPTASKNDARELVPGAAGVTMALERLGIPHTVLSDGPAGLRINPKRPGDSHTYYCTGFPVGTCLASSWDTDLVYRVCAAMGNEVKEYGADVLLAPGMNIHRNPLCGRNFEYFSEDPVLCGKIASAYVRGVQSNGVGVSIKHFAANNQESNRTGNDVMVSQRALREIYLKGFEIAVKEANPWTVMASYNKINGTLTQESHDLLTTILRDEWGFKGMVMTDWIGLRNTSKQVHAGNDLMMPGDKRQINDLMAKIKSGALSENDVNVCVRRVLQYIVKTPRFNSYKYTNTPDLKAHATVARESAPGGMVLLKDSDQTLPLAKGYKKIALFGVTSYDFIAGGTGSGDVNKAYVVNVLQGLTNNGYQVDRSLVNVYKSYMPFADSVRTMELGELARMGFYSKPRLAEATLSEKTYNACAERNDVAVITLGRNAGEGADRDIVGDFNLSGEEIGMLRGVCAAFHKAGKKVVVVLNIGGVIATSEWKDLPDAILLAWQPGQEGGNAIADVLSGHAYPSGKLPMTFPVNYTDIPSSANFPLDYAYTNDWRLKDYQKENMANIGTTYYNEGIYVGYRYFCTAHKAVSYPFGYGLSYTQFAYSKPKISKSGKGFEVIVTVTNKGKAAGKEIVELFVSPVQGPAERAERELKAFAKTHELQPGEQQTLKMHFSNYDLARYDEQQQAWVTDGGEYKALFSASANDSRLALSFKVSPAKYPCHNVLAPVKDLHQMTLK